jgi:hypothetical protein
MPLSGKFRFRKGTFGNLVLQIEEVRKGWWRRGEKPTWRNAKAIDLAAPELRLLIDLSNGHALVPLSRAAAAGRPAPAALQGENASTLPEQQDPKSVVIH